jgi:hypothetical protein
MGTNLLQPRVIFKVESKRDGVRYINEDDEVPRERLAGAFNDHNRIAKL